MSTSIEEGGSVRQSREILIELEVPREEGGVLGPTRRDSRYEVSDYAREALRLASPLPAGTVVRAVAVPLDDWFSSPPSRHEIYEEAARRGYGKLPIERGPYVARALVGAHLFTAGKKFYFGHELRPTFDDGRILYVSIVSKADNTAAALLSARLDAPKRAYSLDDQKYFVWVSPAQPR